MLRKASKKADLFIPLDKVLTRDSLESFGEELLSFIDGMNSFESEFTAYDNEGGINHTLAVITIVSGYEDTWSRVIVSNVDITYRKMAEEALRKRDERFSEVQRIANIGQWEYDNVTGEGYWSEEYYRIHGFEPGEVTPIEASVMAQVHPDDREMLNKINWVTLPQGELRHIEFRIILKDGSVRHIHCAGRSGGLDKEGRHVGAIGFDQNITDYKEAQEKLKRAINEAEISTKRAALANQAKGRFLSHMSHELRTPLSAVIGYSDMMLRNFFGTLNKKQTASMEMIEESSKYLLNLINDILDLTKIDSGQTEIEMEVFSAEDLIDAMLSLLKTQFDKKRINVESSIDPAISEIWCDLRKCKQILLNLLSNAIKYTPENGLIVIRTELVGDSAIRISVQDSGVGIPADQIEDIFSEFYQVDRVRDEGMGGAGIGLALTRRLVELHAGKIGVESTPGQGSKFWFTLPFASCKVSGFEYRTGDDVGS